MMYLLTLAGFALLFGGGELLVRGAVAVAERFGLSRLLVGLTVVAFATSAPELLVSVQSALAGRSALALGNVVGSNIANVALILGAAALIAGVTVDPTTIRRDGLVLFGVSAAMLVPAMLGRFGRLYGLLAIAVLVAYIWWSYRAEAAKSGSAEECDTWHAGEAEEYESKTGAWAGVALVAVGVALLVLGANWLIDGASSIARTFGVPEAIVGLTVVAIGTSLPEFATSVIASFRGHTEVAVGNVIGSNIFNILSILGITALVRPFPADPTIAYVDIPIMIAITVLGVGALMWRGKLARWFGALLLVLYVAYTVFLYTLGRG